jgi:hypothetical protein
VRGLADGVLFEFGPSRQRNLALRDRIRRWQPQLRILFGTRTALLKYRLQFPGFELPQAVRLTQLEFDNRLAQTLDGMADRMEDKGPELRENLEDSFKRLEQTTLDCCSESPKEALAARLQAFLFLSRRIESLTSALAKEIWVSQFYDEPAGVPRIKRSEEARMRPITNILFPVDFSPSCIAMAPYVKRAATCYGAKVSLIHVFDPASYNGFELYVRRSEEIAEEHREIARNRHNSFLQDEFPASQHARILVAGDAGAQIARLPGTASISSSCRRMLVLSGGCSLVPQQPRCSMMQIAQS